MDKTIELDFKLWIKSELYLDDFVAIQLLVENRERDFHGFVESLGTKKTPLSTDWLAHGDCGKPVPTLKAKYLFKDKDDIALWIDEWRNKFPPGASENGNRWRSTRPSCLKKMRAFMKKYKCSKEDVYKATDNYLRKMNGDFKYCKMATNFIYKDTIEESGLLSEIDGLSEKPLMPLSRMDEMV